jgi:cellulose biosynthesis protein BcsQ
MKKIRIVIADLDKSYIESMSSYLRSSDQSDRFITAYFTGKTTFTKFLNQTETIDILLISPDFYDESIHIPEDTALILLEDNVIQSKANPHSSVYRYQRLDKLFSSVLSIYYEHNQQAGKYLARSKKTQVLTVYSPVGGVGKTTIAVNLSKQLALHDMKVFYLNLELLNSTHLYFQSEEDNPSLQILYYVKSNSSQLLSKVEALKKTDPFASVDYFDLATNAEELLEMTPTDVRVLINAIIETGAYDYVVVDLDSSIHKRNVTAIEECDQLIWPILNNEQSLFKTKAFLEEEEKLFEKENVIKDKLIILMNQFFQKMEHVPVDYEWSIDGHLPFIPAWMGVAEERDVLDNESFNQELQSIIQKRILSDERTVMNIG